MQEGEIGYQNQGFGETNIKVRGLEEKQRILKNRVLLIGQNMIETKEQNQEKILEIIKDVEMLKQSLEGIKNFLETISNEFSKFATIDDLEILRKQAKMFQPLKLVNK